MDRRTTLVYYENGTAQSVSEEDPLASFAVGLITLACLLLSVAYNFIIVAAVMSTRKLRKSAFRVAVASVCATCLVDSALVESLALFLLLTGPPGLCAVSAAAFHTVLLCLGASLGPLCAERALAQLGRPVSPGSCLAAALAAYAIALGLSSPLLTAPEVHYFPNRNSCGAAGSILLPTFTLIGLVFSSGIVLSWIFFCVFYLSSDINNLQPFNLSVLPLNVSLRSDNANTNVEKSKLACTVVFLFTILVLPLSTSVVVELFLPLRFLPDPWIDPRRSNETRSVSTQLLEPLFTYSRYMYDAVVPIMVLISDRDIRIAGRSIFCCRGNKISTVNNLESEAQLKLSLEPVASDTPVLFATSDGVFLTVPQKAVGVDQDEASRSGVNLRLSSTVCDSSALKPYVDNEIFRPLKRVEENEMDRNGADKESIVLATKPRSFSPPVESLGPNSPQDHLSGHANSGRTYRKL